MSKYINADELKKRLSDDDVQFLKLVVSNKKMQSLEELIDEMPAADVVEVVQCKDCVSKDKAKLNSKGFLICPDSGMEICDDDYCSYAERRESE